MNAIWGSVVVKVVLGLAESLGGWLRQKHDAAKQQTADSQKKALESVGESAKKEEEIREGQKDVEKNPSDVKKPDGSVDAGDWNAGK